MRTVKERQGVDNTGVPVTAQGSSYATALPCSKNKYESTYVKMTHATGAEGQYFKQYVTGAGTDGEAGRSVNSIYNVAATNAYGRHDTLAFNTSGSVTGLGVVARHTLEPAAGTMTNGTYACQMSEMYFPASNNMSGVTQLSFYRVVLAGDRTALALAEDKAQLFGLSGFTVGNSSSGNMFCQKNAAAVSHVLRIRDETTGTPYYIMVSDAI